MEKPVYHLHDIWRGILDQVIRTCDDVKLWQCVCKWTRMHSVYLGHVTGETSKVSRDLLARMSNWYDVVLSCRSDILLIAPHYTPSTGNLGTSMLTMALHKLSTCSVGQIILTTPTYASALSAITCDHLHLNTCYIETQYIPQVSHLRIIDHITEVDVSHCTRLQQLYIRRSCIRIQPHMHIFTSLTSLDIDGDSRFDALPYMPLLRTLHTNISRIENLRLMTALTDLSAPVTDNEILSLVSLTTIATPHLSEYFVVGLSSWHLSSLVNLPITTLCVRTKPADFRKITQLTSLTRLYMHGCMSPCSPRILCMLTHVHTLGTSADSSNLLFKRMTNLTSLELTNCTRMHAQSLTLLTSLTHLGFAQYGCYSATTPICNDMHTLTMLTNLRTIYIQGKPTDALRDSQLEKDLGVVVIRDRA